MQAFDSGVKNLDIVAHRRSGKDKVCMALLAKAMVTRKGGYFYVFPEFNQGRKALWDNIDNDGFNTLQHIPEAIWERQDNQQMKLQLKNGSYMQVVGSGDVNSLVGTNPMGIVYSEWSLQDPQVKGYLDPILKGNKGWQIFNYTPRGNNHAKGFHENAQNLSNWFSTTITVADTKLFTPEELTEIREEYVREHGDDGLFQQEYYCSFETPVQGSYYGHHMSLMEAEGRINDVQWNSDLGVYTAWDLGASDSTCIWFYQKVGDSVHIIDYYEVSGAGMEHFRDLLESKPYRYSRHYMPHDADNKQQTGGQYAESRVQMLRKLGISNIDVLPRDKRVNDRIQRTRLIFPRVQINRKNCERGIMALKEYKKEWSEKNKMWNDLPLHDWASHSCLRGDSMIKTLRGDVAIKDVVVGDQAWTPMGYRKVLASGMTKIADKTIRIETADGEELICTPEHKIFTDRGVVRADALRYNDRVWRQADLKRLNFKELPTNFRDDIMLRPQVYGRSTATYTGRFGRFIMGRFQKAITSTTKTGTDSTTSQRTWSVLRPLTTFQSMRVRVSGWARRLISGSLSRLRYLHLRNGTDQKKGENGTVSTESKLGRIGNGLRKIAHFVGRNTKRLIPADRSSATRIVKLTHEDADLPVYDLTVEHHHCYLANGLLVSNSDAFGYLAQSLGMNDVTVNRRSLEKRLEVIDGASW